MQTGSAQRLRLVGDLKLKLQKSESPKIQKNR